jgi:hypothetical protein
MGLRGQRRKKIKIKRCILESKMRGKMIFKPFSIFVGYPLRGLSPVGKSTSKI